MDEKKLLTDVEYWNERQAEEIQLPSGGTQPLWIREVADHLPRGKDTTFLEIGVVPGGVLMYFACKLGYECTGIDFSPKVNLLQAEFARHGLKARFVQADFLTWQPGEKFDIVYSGGFIEHFTDYENIVRKHWDLVAPGGYLLLSIPTFTTPVQKLIRRFLFTRTMMREVWSAHHTQMMNLSCLKKAVQACPDAEIEVASYAAGMTVCFGHRMPGVRSWTRPFFPGLRLIERMVAALHISSGFFSPMAVVLARKQCDAT